MTEDEIVGWHHRLYGHEFAQPLGVGDGQGGLACCSVCVLVVQSCLTLCNPVNCSLLGSSVLGSLRARVLEWVASSFSRDLPNQGIKPGSPTLHADSLPSELPGKPCATTI